MHYQYHLTDGILARTDADNSFHIELLRKSGKWEQYTDIAEFAHNSRPISPEEAEEFLQNRRDPSSQMVREPDPALGEQAENKPEIA